MAYHIPPPLMTIILSRLPVKSLVRFRCVAKSWCTLIDSAYFINLHLKHSFQTFTNHTLILKVCRLPQLYSVDYPTLDHAIRIHCPYSLHPTSHIVGSCNGLLCVIDFYKRLPTFLYNPTTREFRVIPSFPSTSYQQIYYGFGYDHVNDDYKLVCIVRIHVSTGYRYYRSYNACGIRVFSLRAKCWKRVKDFPLEYIKRSKGTGAFVNGRLHWIVHGLKHFVAFDLATEKCSILPQPEYEYCSGSTSKEVDFGVLEGCLMAQWTYSDTRVDVWIMKEYGVKESWTKLCSVPGKKSIGQFAVSCLRVIGYSKTRRGEVLIEKDRRELVHFSVQHKTARTVKTKGLPSSFIAVPLVESLVSLEKYYGVEQPNTDRHAANSEHWLIGIGNESKCSQSKQNDNLARFSARIMS